MDTKQKTAKIYELLNARYSGRDWIHIQECRFSTGYEGHAQRQFDFFVISSRAGNITYGFEVKASRADFLKDLADKDKQFALRMYSNYFYYVCPKDMIKIEEIPEWAGLMYANLEGMLYKQNDGKEIMLNPNVYNVKTAPYFQRAQPHWGFVAQVIRNLDETQRSWK